VSALAGPNLGWAAADYDMATVVDYRVDPGNGLITVAVDITFTNTRPDAPNAESVFTVVEFAVQNGASDPAATDSTGVLTPTIADRSGIAVASIPLRKALASGETVQIAFSYRLIDGADPAIRVRSGIVAFPVWSFGTSSSVTVELPSDFAVRTSGNPLTPTPDGDILRLSSGPIDDPAHWLVNLAAERPGEELVTVNATVPLSGSTVELRVRSWPDDPAWRDRILELATIALPLLEDVAGLPYPGGGTVTLVESAASGEPTAAADELEVGFNASDFVVVHQLAHLWYGETLFADRWLREGLASHAAALVADDADLTLPYDPPIEAERLTADAIPLAEWTVGVDPADSWGYAASWTMINDVAAGVGEAGLQEVISAIADGLSGYASVSGNPAMRSGLAVDSRRFVDLAEPLGTRTFDPADLLTIFGEPASPELAARQTSRQRAVVLHQDAGELGLPDPVVGALTAWDFVAADAAMAEAAAWLDDRDALVADITAAGLMVPDRLTAGFREFGGGQQAQVEIAAEAAVVDAYVAAQERAAEPRSFLEEVGLLGVEPPEQTLDRAAGAFATGDLRTAADLSAAVVQSLNDAGLAGIMRVAAVGVGAAAALAAGIVALRHRRRART
jgi:hypothetical protein